MKLIEQIKQYDPCSDAVEWLGDKTLRQAWRMCHRGDWMLWLAACANVDRKALVRAAVECARPAVERYVPKTEKRPAKCLSVTLAWTRGRATLGQARAAAAYAAANADDDAAAYAAAATYAAANADDDDAAYAAAAAAATTYAADAAAYAAAATYAAAAAYAADAAATDARKKSLAESAATVRRLIPVELVEKALAACAKLGEK